MKEVKDYTPEELSFYLYQQQVMKARTKKTQTNAINSEKGITKREAREKAKELKAIKRQEKIVRREAAKKKVEYWSKTTPKYRSYLRGAISRGLTFSLSVEQFNSIITNTDCVFCGTNKTIGVGRIDSSKHYVMDNCQPCCTLCNLMKRNMSDNDFILHITKIINKFRK